MSVDIFTSRDQIAQSGCDLPELRTKFWLGGAYRGLYRVLGGTYSGI